MAPSAAVSQSRPGEAAPTEAAPTEAAVVAPCHDTPVLVMDGRVVERRYLDLRSALPGVDLHFAVKADPAAAVLRVLAGLGCRWDVASPGEIDAALDVVALCCLVGSALATGALRQDRGRHAVPGRGRHARRAAAG